MLHLSPYGRVNNVTDSNFQNFDMKVGSFGDI